MQVVQCFRCNRWVEESATENVATTDAEAAGTPAIFRLWCGTCLHQVRQDTAEALNDRAKSLEEDSEQVTGWTVVRDLDEARKLLEKDE